MTTLATHEGSNGVGAEDPAVVAAEVGHKAGQGGRKLDGESLSGGPGEQGGGVGSHEKVAGSGGVRWGATAEASVQNEDKAETTAAKAPLDETRSRQKRHRKKVGFDGTAKAVTSVRSAVSLSSRLSGRPSRKFETTERRHWQKHTHVALQDTMSSGGLKPRRTLRGSRRFSASDLDIIPGRAAENIYGDGRLKSAVPVASSLQEATGPPGVPCFLLDEAGEEFGAGAGGRVSREASSSMSDGQLVTWLNNVLFLKGPNGGVSADSDRG